MGDSDPLGLASAYGAAGEADALQKAMARRFAQQQYADLQKQREFQNLLETRKAAALEDQNRQMNQWRQDTQAEAQKDREIKLGQELGDRIPGGTFLPENSPSVGMLRTAGLDSILSPQAARPEVSEGPLQQGDTGAARSQGFLKMPSEKQLADAAKAGKPSAEDDTRRYAHWLPDESTNKLVNVLDDTHPAASQTHPESFDGADQIAVSGWKEVVSQEGIELFRGIFKNRSNDAPCWSKTLIRLVFGPAFLCSRVLSATPGSTWFRETVGRR